MIETPPLRLRSILSFSTCSAAAFRICFHLLSGFLVGSFFCCVGVCRFFISLVESEGLQLFRCEVCLVLAQECLLFLSKVGMTPVK